MAAGWFDRDAAAAGWFAPESEEAGWFGAELLGGEAPAQELTAPLVSNDQTFYGPQVTATYALAAPLVVNGQTFHGPQVTTTYAIAAPLLANTQTFPAAEVLPGAVGLLPGLLTNAQQFYAATVSQPQPEPYEYSLLLPGGPVFQYGGDEQIYLLPGSLVVQPPAQDVAPPTPSAGAVLWRDRPPRLWSAEDDDADLLEIATAIIGVLNAKQRH